MELTLSNLYERYNNILKPLISEIEGRLETFALPLLHSLSSMLDAVALAESSQDEERKAGLEMANEALDLSISLSYQYLIYALKEEIEKFEERVPKDVIEKLGGGIFIGPYKSLRKKSISLIEKCKHEDNDLKCLPLYKEAYENMSKLERMISEHNTEALIAKKEKRSWYVRGAIKITSILISLGVGYLVSGLLISMCK